MRGKLSAVILALGLWLASPAAAETIVSTFGPGDTFDSVNSYFVGFSSLGFQQQSVAARFTTGGATFELDSIRFALSVPFPPPPQLATQPGAQFSVALVSTPAPFLTGIQFGTVLESFPFVFTPGVDVDPQIFTANSVVHPLLVPELSYFVALFPTGSGGAFWHLNDQGVGGFAFRQASSTWIACNPTTTNACLTPAYEVTGTRVAPVPEPASLTLLGAGLAALFALRRQRH